MARRIACFPITGTLRSVRGAFAKSWAEQQNRAISHGSRRGLLVAVALAVAAVFVSATPAKAIPITCDETTGATCPGAPLNAAAAANNPDLIAEDVSHYFQILPRDGIYRPGVIVLTTPGEVNGSDFVVILCGPNGNRCTAAMTSGPLDSGEDREKNFADTVNQAQYNDALTAALNDTMNTTTGAKVVKSVPEIGTENVLEVGTYTVKSDSGTITYTIISDIPEPATLTMLLAPIGLAGLDRFRRRSRRAPR